MATQTFWFLARSLGKWSNLTSIFQLGWFNHQLEQESEERSNPVNERYDKSIDILGRSYHQPSQFPPWNQKVAPENGSLEDDPFLLGFSLFSAVVAVSFREPNFIRNESMNVMLGFLRSKILYDIINYQSPWIRVAITWRIITGIVNS